MTELPIGIFDSGVGGLTVLAALEQRLPRESFLYLGDTARLPYGTKSAGTVTRYALRAAKALEARGVKALVVACNTASAIALEALEAEMARLPVFGVVRPGAAAAAAATKSGRIAVISTESTAREGAYVREIRRLLPAAQITSMACPLFVALAEEGWISGPIVEAVAREYLGGTFSGAGADGGGKSGGGARGAGPAPDTLVLGCTHCPPLAGAIRRVVGEGVALVDSAATTAEVVAAALAERGLSRRAAPRETAGASDAAFAAPDRAPPQPPVHHFLATDAPERFARVARHFLPERLAPADVELADL